MVLLNRDSNASCKNPINLQALLIGLVRGILRIRLILDLSVLSHPSFSCTSRHYENEELDNDEIDDGKIDDRQDDDTANKPTDNDEKTEDKKNKKEDAGEVKNV